MSFDWRNTLKMLLPQFEVQATRSLGLNHLFVEVADHERGRMSGPTWFRPFSGKVQVIDGRPRFDKWDASSGGGLPGIEPGYREAMPKESFTDSDSDRIIRDGSGVVRAVFVPMRLRKGFLCGQPSESVSGFKSLADMAARALANADDLHNHVFASDLTDLFRKPRGGVRYIFGEVGEVPRQFIAQGWDAGVLQYEHGVLIDAPISESDPNADHWLLLLHRLGWHRSSQSVLRADRWAWKENVEVSFETVLRRKTHPEVFPDGWMDKIPSDSFYSILGTKEAPLDVNLASAFAIQLLLSELSVESKAVRENAETLVDYSNEDWHIAKTSQVRSVKREDCEATVEPRIGILVATEVEREAVLKKLRPPRKSRTVYQVFEGNNTFFVGRLGAVDVVLCMTAMGSVGRDSSTLVASELIRSWQLKAVIMVGIAFGKDPLKQEIGNVLISDRVIPFEPQRIGEKSNEDRGQEHAARPVLLNRFRNFFGWHFSAPNGRNCGYQVGPILSGEKLVDNHDFKKELFHRYPTAIGGEMEGAGVAAAAERAKCEWVIVKAICDWGDGTKSKHHQGFAAAASVSLVEHVLNQPSVLDSLLT